MSWIDGVIIAGALVGVALCLWIFQRIVPHPVRRPHNDVAGFIFASVGVTYAVLLAFVVVAVWENVDAARKTTFTEADEVAGLYWIARQMPLPLGGQLERDTLQYAHTVIDQEWSQMADHHSSPTATNLVYDMRNAVFAFAPANEAQQVLYDHALTHLENLASARRERLDELGEAVPPLLWSALLAGGVVTIGFTFLFGLSDNIVHSVMVLALTALVVISLVVIKEMDYPFTGVAQIHPTAFEVFLERLPPPR